MVIKDMTSLLLTLKKKELQALLTDIERVLNQTSTNANNAAKEYSSELVAQLAFEV